MKASVVICLMCLPFFCTAQETKQTRSVKLSTPEGMKYIPSGTLIVPGPAGAGAASAARPVQLNGFFIDATEVTNAQYRQFVNYVRDSIANTLLGNTRTLPNGSKGVVMKKIDWNDPDVQERLAPMMMQGANGKTQLDVSKLQYHYSVFDEAGYSKHPQEAPERFIITMDVNVYPDTTVWAKQLPNSFSLPIASQYAWFQAFNNYPVVGVNLAQCTAFCDWRTRMWQAEHPAEISGFRLPTEWEWEWAAKGGNGEVKPYTAPALTHDAFSDGTIGGKNKQREANGYGLFDMEDGVSEWTASKPEGPNGFMLSYIVRGGNWCQEPADRQVNVRLTQINEQATAYTGFRCIFSQVIIK